MQIIERSIEISKIKLLFTATQTWQSIRYKGTLELQSFQFKDFSILHAHVFPQKNHSKFTDLPHDFTATGFALLVVELS
jgi:hypothetical protein